MTTNGGDVVFVVNSFLSGIRIRGRDARRAAAPFVHLFSFESGPNPARTSNSGCFPGIGEKVMHERSEKRFLHHFLRGRRVE